ncbi:STAS domain-containing protein [Scytonema sp. NUACC21]
MGLNGKSHIPEILDRYEAEVLAEWFQELKSVSNRRGLLRDVELHEECKEFLLVLKNAVQQGNLNDIQSPEWNNVRDTLTSISRSRSQKGFTSTETASFVFSFKQPLFSRLRSELQQDGLTLSEEIWLATTLLDKLGLLTTEVYQKVREEIIIRQQEELLELSTPVVKLWDNILVLPLIGTLDSSRTQVIMESLLQKIVDTGSEMAIIDITGVPTVDTLTAQHLLKTITAARLMGAECIVSGIRPQIAQTIVYLGVDLADVVTKATLADAFALALARLGCRISCAPERS